MDPRRALSFGAVASSYDLGRPTYPAEALRWVLPPHARTALDLGAGTGKLTRGLRALGLDVVAVEPDDAMRAVIGEGALPGTAEAIPLPDASVDAVFVGQAFHWFDQERALPEMVRVLRPGGAIGLLWNLFDDRVPWVAELCAIWNPEDTVSVLAGMGPPFDGPTVGLSPIEQLVVEHEHQLDRDLLEANLRSRSPFILMSEQEREAKVTAARALVPEHFALPYACNTWRASKTA
jgi:SAM-dependent methyltransferase